MIIIRLYRAISKRELEVGITSLEIKKLSIADEVYSHVISSYQLRKGPLFSFTDKLSVAEKYLKLRPDKYATIGYVDIKFDEVTGEFQLPKEIELLYRISQEEDWLDLIEQENNGNEINNLNYKTYPVNNFAKMFVPSQKGIVSWSRNASEYVAICRELHMEIIDSSYIEPMNFRYTDTIKRKRRPFYNYPKYINDLNNLQLNTLVRKKHVEKVLRNYKKLCIETVS